MPGVISKLVIEDAPRLLGAHPLVASRAVCSAAILGYLAHVVGGGVKGAATGDAGDKEKAAVGHPKGSSNLKGGSGGEKRLAEKRDGSPAVNREFWKRLRFLFRILFPSLVCRESGLLALHTLVLVARTFLSIYVASLEGTMVRNIVQKDVSSFGGAMGKWFAVAIPATFTNSAIR